MSTPQHDRDEPALPPGFEPIRRLGQGGMGVVYLARQVSLNRTVALKLLPPPPRAEAAARAERFRREAELMARAAHPNIVPIHDFGVFVGRPFLVMEYIEGGDLSRMIASGSALPPERVRELVDSIARALTCLHRAGIVHRDLKPANILMLDGRTPRVADFGIATLSAAPGAIAAAGTPDYMAPEQRYGLKVDERCDQYSLAAVAYELLTGRRPVGAFAPPSKHQRGLAQAVDEAILRALSEDRDDRFATVEEFAEALGRGLRASRRVRARAWTVLAAAVGLLALGLSVLRRDETHRSAAPAPVAVDSAPREKPSSPAPRPADQAAAEPPKSFKNTLGMTMFLMMPGEFEMGSPPTDPDALNDERPRHRVRLSRPFYLAECEVTYSQFFAFVERTGYKTEAEASGLGGHIFDVKVKDIVRSKEWTFRHPRPNRVPADDEPVVQVTWNDARAFCDWLLKEEGRPYRLPTEAEWEYACRAGTTTRWSTGDDPASLDAAAWTWRNAGHWVHPVGLKAANPWGFRDMHGNAWEWCEDRFGMYKAEPETDPAGAATGTRRTLRGGSWDFGTVARTRSASRLADPADRPHFTHGFRVAIGSRGNP